MRRVAGLCGRLCLVSSGALVWPGSGGLLAPPWVGLVLARADLASAECLWLCLRWLADWRRRRRVSGALVPCLWLRLFRLLADVWWADVCVRRLAVACRLPGACGVWDRCWAECLAAFWVPGDAVERGLVELVDVSWWYAFAQALDEVAGLGLLLEEYLKGLADSVDLGSILVWDCAAAIWLAGPGCLQRTSVDHGSLRPMIYEKKSEIARREFGPKTAAGRV